MCGNDRELHPHVLGSGNHSDFQESVEPMSHTQGPAERTEYAAFPAVRLRHKAARLSSTSRGQVTFSVSKHRAFTHDTATSKTYDMPDKFIVRELRAQLCAW